MEPIYVAFTAVMFLASALCAVHARGDTDRLTFYGAAVVYGLLLEKLVILTFSDYTYPAERMLDVFGIPVAIGLGWSAVIYSGYVTAGALGLSDRHLPVFTALYALHLDLAGDAVAVRVPFWIWNDPGPWFGVPLGNFVGWYLVALFFPLSFRRLSKRVSNPLVVGVGTIASAVALLIGGLAVWKLLHQDVLIRQVVIFGVLIAASVAFLSTATLRPTPIPRIVTAVTFLLHGFFFAVLVDLELYAARPALLAVSLAVIGLGVVVHFGPAIRSGSRASLADGEVP